LSLWENLQIEVGFSHANDFQSTLKPEWASLLSLLKNPEIQTSKAKNWEKFVVSLLKGLMNPSQNLLIDINEELLSPFIIQHFKNNILQATNDKSVFLASARSSLWLDCAHTLVEQKEYKFETEAMDTINLKKNWAA
jgi:ABC-type branched-subunit amino acid transport system ATPase component